MTELILENEVTVVDAVVVSSDIFVIDQTTEVVTVVGEVLEVEEDVFVIELANGQGPPGRDAEGAINVRFEWNSITILPIIVAVTGKTVFRVEVCLIESFDGVNPSLSVGDSVDHERLMSTSQVDPSIAATFSSNPGYRYSAGTQVNLYINSGSGASKGSGVVTVYMEQ